MPTAQIKKETSVTIVVTEEEAGKIRRMLIDHVNLDVEKWADELDDALIDLDIPIVRFATWNPA